MTQLAETVDAEDEMWTIDTMPESPYLQVEDELVEIRSRYPEHIYQPTQEVIAPKIRVRRAFAGTSAASHADTTTLTPVYGAGTGAGGAIPDPATGDDGDVPTVQSGVYTLAPSVGDVQVVTRSLTSAELLTLFSAPITLVEGVAGVIYWPLAAFLHYTHVTAGYDKGAATLLCVGASNQDDTPLFTDPDSVLGAQVEADQSAQLVPLSHTYSPDSAMVGEPLRIWMMGDDLVSGDGTLYVVALYRAVDVS